MLAFYNATSISLMQSMYKHHRFEFKNHIKPMLLLFMATEISVICQLEQLWFQLYHSYCSNGDLKDNEAVLAKGEEGLCNYFYSELDEKVDDPHWVAGVLEWSTFMILLPVTLFLLFDNPHDCFVCLGKDPDRIYSIFQLSKEVRVKRKMKAKYNDR